MGQGEIDILSEEECIAALGARNYDHEIEICAGRALPNGEWTEAGCRDSGGPLFVWDEPLGPQRRGKEIEVGIVSWGFGDSPNVYARVSAYRDWIAETIAASERLHQLSPDAQAPAAARAACSTHLTNTTCKQNTSCAWCGSDGTWKPSPDSSGREQCYDPTTQQCILGDLDCYPLVCNSSSIVCHPTRGCVYGSQPQCFAAGQPTDPQACCSARHAVSSCAAGKGGEKCCTTDGYTSCYTDEQECCNPYAPVVMPLVCSKGKCPPNGEHVCVK